MYVTRVHPFIEQIDRLAFAGAIHAADDDDYRKACGFCQIVLRVEQGFPEPGCFAVISCFLDLVAQLRGFEHEMSSPKH